MFVYLFEAIWDLLLVIPCFVYTGLGSFESSFLSTLIDFRRASISRKGVTVVYFSLLIRERILYLVPGVIV